MTALSAVRQARPPAPPAATPPPALRQWAPRIWEGADAFTWLRILAKNKAAVQFPYWYIAAIVSGATVGHTVLRWLHEGRFGDRIAATPIPHAPVFVVGHWRTGTTLLHELLIRDDRFAYPDTFACFLPHHILLTEGFFKTYCRWMVPDRRPMDNMAAGWERPQEDEFALALLGLPSTYTDFAFPNHPPLHPGSLDLSGLTPSQLRTWKRTFRRFLQTLTYRDPRRLVLKSPPHTARIRVLLELFPDAKFVHIVRDPYVVYPSTVNLWQSLGRKHGFQTPTGAGVPEKVFREFRTIYDRLEEAKPLIPAGQFHELRYEELVADPVGEMAKVYAGLDLGGFDRMRPKLEEYVRTTAGYETNKYAVTPAERAEITRRWGDVIERYGYGGQGTGDGGQGTGKTV